MSYSVKEREEWAILKDLAIRDPDIFGGEWTKGESPDFRKTVNGKRFGLEVTRFTIPKSGPSTAWEQALEDIRLGCIAETSREPYYKVEVLAKHKRPPKLSERRAIVRDLVKIARENQPCSGESSVDLSGASELAAFGVRKMSVWKPSTPESKPPFWRFAHGGGVGKLNVARLTSIIDRKNQSLCKYVGQFDEVWLVVAGESMGLSSFSEPPDVGDLKGIHSDFHRTWFFTCCSYKLIELP